jgi:hypothetical protein
MRRTPELNEQEREPDDREPSSDRARPGRPFPTTQSDDDDEYVGVAHRRPRAPVREADEEDVAEEDIMDVLDDEDEVTAEG